MANCQKFDDALFSLLAECKSLPTFLDTVFGFLSRRTDFYHVAEDITSPIGLPEGWAEEFVRRAFFKWKPKDTELPKLNEFRKSKENATKIEKSQEIDRTIEIEKARVIEQTPETEKTLDIENIPLALHEIEVSTSSDQASTLVASNIQFSTSESYNGAVFENYSWSQSINEIDVSVTIPENVSKKELSVQIHSKNICVKLKNSDQVLLKGELCYKCKHQDAIWSLDKKKLEIHLEKASEVWWNCLTLDEPKLDVTKIDCSRPFEELPEEAQAKIEELTWNQERKRLGLPTSDELAMHERLKKGWNVEGSPFKGPFDPNTVILN